MMSQAFFFFDAVNLAGQRGFILVGLKPECVKSDKECYICKEIFFIQRTVLHGLKTKSVKNISFLSISLPSYESQLE